MELGYVSFGVEKFALEEAKISSLLSRDQFISWTFELYPPGEDNYIMINSIILEELKTPQELSGFTFDATSETDDLYEHTVFVNGEPSFMESLSFEIKTWDKVNEIISFSGAGTVYCGDDLIDFKFEANCKWTGMNVQAKDKQTALELVLKFWNVPEEKLSFSCESVAEGIACQFKLMD